LFVAALVSACGHRGPTPLPVAPPPGFDAAPVAPPDAAPAVVGPPAARTVDVRETVFGTAVEDPYRWMETDTAGLTTWLHAQGAYARGYLARIAGHDALLARTHELINGTGAANSVTLAAGRVFYEYTAPGAQLAKLMVRDARGERVLIDPATFGDADHHGSINSFAPSPDGTRVAYQVSLGGGEIGTIHVRDVATGADLPDAVERIWGEMAAAWLPYGTGFFYTQMAPVHDGVDPMLNQQVRVHVLGTSVDKDTTLFGAGLPGRFALVPDEFPAASTSPATSWVVANAGGARSELRLAVARLRDVDRTGAGKTPWAQVADYADGVTNFAARGDRLYLLTFAGASNLKVISVSMAHPDLAHARVDIAEDKDATIVGFSDARDALYIHKQVGGLSHLYRWPWRGAPTEVPLPFVGAIGGLATDPQRDGVTFYEEGWTHAGASYRYDPATRKVASIGLDTVTNADYTGMVADEVVATSADGTGVPLSILHRADLARDGSHPAIVNGYGGYGMSQLPYFSPSRLAWLERGGVYAVCHVRGGAEKGHQWQLDGTHEHKMNGIHDLEACARYLTDAKLSSPAHTFAQGGSMGGILIGRALTEAPALFAAANIQVGMVDPVRILASENGANQVAELGDPRTEAGFKAIYEMSPYAHTTAQAYPATIFTIGLNDGRVAPWMTGKMAARMQAVDTGGKPILIRVEEDAGHGIGSTRDQAAEERADVWSFFLAASGDPAFAVRP
jgi:prolyl oligopeptidase